MPRTVRYVVLGLALVLALSGITGAQAASRATTTTLVGHVHGTGLALEDFLIQVDGSGYLPVAADGSFRYESLAQSGTVSLVLLYQGPHPDGTPTAWLTDEIGDFAMGSGQEIAVDVGFTTISGTVTAGGAPAAATVTSVAEPRTDDAFGTCCRHAIPVNPDGSYLILAVVDGASHRLEVEPRSRRWAREFYPDAISRTTGTEFTYAAGQPITADFDLAPAARISGYLGGDHLHPAFTDKVVELLVDHEVVASTFANRDDSGLRHYAFGGLPAGSYRLRIGGGLGGSWPAFYHPSRPETSGLSGAPTVNVAAGEQRTLAQRARPAVRPGTVVGRIVTRKHGRLVGRRGVAVVAVPLARRLTVRRAVIDDRGAFESTGLSRGRYVLSVWNNEHASPAFHCADFTSVQLASIRVGVDRTSRPGTFRFDPPIVHVPEAGCVIE